MHSSPIRHLSEDDRRRVHGGDRMEAWRLTGAEALLAVWVVAYNWWVAVPFVHGLLPSVNGFFSDLEVPGRPDASWMSASDLTAGIVLVVALVLRGSSSGGVPRREWRWLVAFAAAGAAGGKFTYACSEGLSAACRQLEWEGRLPLHHYVHVVSGIAEFAFLTVAAVLAVRRTAGTSGATATAYRVAAATVLGAYPLLGAAYLTDRFGAFVEPIYFVAFTVMVAAEILEPLRPPDTRSWAERVMARPVLEADRPDVGDAAVGAGTSGNPGSI